MRHPLREFLHWVSYGRNENKYRNCGFGWRKPYKSSATTNGLFFSDQDWLLKLKFGRWSIGWGYRIKGVSGPRTGFGSMDWPDKNYHDYHLTGKRWTLCFTWPRR